MNHSTVAKAVVSNVLAAKYDPAYWGTPTVRNVADTAAHGYIDGKAASIASEDYPSPSGSGWAVDMAHDINEFLTANYPDYWAGPYSGWLLAVYYEPPAGGGGGPSFTVKTTGRDMVSDIVLAARDAGVPDETLIVPDGACPDCNADSGQGDNFCGKCGEQLLVVCAICNNPIGADVYGWAGGHNPEPVASGRCCGPCNRDIVIPARMRQHGYSQQTIADLPEDIS